MQLANNIIKISRREFIRSGETLRSHLHAGTGGQSPKHQALPVAEDQKKITVEFTKGRA